MSKLSRPDDQRSGPHADVVSISSGVIDAARRLLLSDSLDPDDVREIEIAIRQVGADRANGEDPTDSTARLDALVDRLSAGRRPRVGGGEPS